MHGTYVGSYSGGTPGGFVGRDRSFKLLEWPGYRDTTATGINDADAIVGLYTAFGGGRQSYIAYGDDIELLPGLEGYLHSAVFGVNNEESMVGICVDEFGRETALLYLNGDRTPLDMNDLIDPIPGVKLVRGIDINNAGQILVEGAGPTGYTYYVLTPVPEPGAAGAMVVVLALVRRRNRWRSRAVGV